MPRKKIKADPTGVHFSVNSAAQPLSYEISLLTPLVGGGVKSWIPDTKFPVRTQSVKGHLRFWWRAMQGEMEDLAALQAAERDLWGGTGGGTARASKVRISIQYLDRIKVKLLERNPNGSVVFDTLPDYVLFPFQVLQETDLKVVEEASFSLSIECPAEQRSTLDQCVRLWVLFGGIGARTRRGCGSLYCRGIMDDYPSPEEIAQFLNLFTEGPILSTAPNPNLNGSIFVCRIAPNQDNPSKAWKSFLDRYKHFRQGVNCGRNPGTGNRPGRTRWPEADTLRRITNCLHGAHTPNHPAGNWFPRGAYGLPIQTEFRNEPSDPEGKFMLQPRQKERWPSPVILKIIKLGDGRLLETGLILNARIPDDLEIAWGKDNRHLHALAPNEMPLSAAGKKMPSPGPIQSGENPYDGLINHLNLKAPGDET